MFSITSINNSFPTLQEAYLALHFTKKLSCKMFDFKKFIQFLHGRLQKTMNQRSLGPNVSDENILKGKGCYLLVLNPLLRHQYPYIFHWTLLICKNLLNSVIESWWYRWDRGRYRSQHQQHYPPAKREIREILDKKWWK